MEERSIENILKEKFSNRPEDEYAVLTFGDLEIGDKYISLPVPGDNSGHGGFKGTTYIFEKIEETGPNKDNSINRRGLVSRMPDTMPIIKVE